MPVIGKDKLFNCHDYKTFFKSIQGIEGHTLFDRYRNIESLIRDKVAVEFQDFLAEPIIENGAIEWYGKRFFESPRKITELVGEERDKYEEIKLSTIEHYNKVINSLNNLEAETLRNAIKFVNTDFIYCYDGIVVLGIWGMELRDNVRESFGVSMRKIAAPVVKAPKMQDEGEKVVENIEEDIVTSSESAAEEEDKPLESFKIIFDTGEFGESEGNEELHKNAGATIVSSDIPKINTIEGYEFDGWDKNPLEYNVNADTIFKAKYKQIIKEVSPPPIILLPWYVRFWNWLKTLLFGRGCLKWLLWILLILLLIWLLSLLFRSCNNDHDNEVITPITEKPWLKEDPRVGDDGGIYDPGNPYKAEPTPPEYSDILPPNQGFMPPVDSSNVIRDPGKPVIVSNRLNILMENEDKSIFDLAKDFKSKYPSSSYKVVYYDNVVKRMQIECPVAEREKLKAEIPVKLAPKYELFVFDEAIMESEYITNDPAFKDPNKAWYFKAINAPKAWEITKGKKNGKKITIAIVDNGFSLNHPELKSKVVMPYNVWSHSKNIFPQKVDHGTHVAGTALATANNGVGLSGIAPDCSFMPVQVADKKGIMTTTSVLDGILYSLYQGADVINVSLGPEFEGNLGEAEQRELQNNHYKEEERLWNEVMRIANKHKAIIVIAAGNENMLAGMNPMNRPKNFVIVSAVNKGNNQYHKAGFSNYGDCSTISAPGVGIYSCVGNKGFQVMDGTSMAAPIVAGTIALMKSLNKNLSAEEVICILQSTGKPSKGKIGNLIQIDKALLKVKSGKFKDCKSLARKPSSGDVQVLLSWNNYNDLDLVCVDPNNERVWFKNKSVSSGGKLEIDMNVNYPDSKTAIENIFWKPGTAPNGKYSVFLVYFKKHTIVNETQYKIKLKYGDKTKEFSGRIKREDKSIPICTFVLGNASKSKNTNISSSNIDKENLFQKGIKVQGQVDDIDKDLKAFKNKNNIKK